MAKFSEHYTPRIETGKGEGLSKMTEIWKYEMNTKRSNKALPEVIPPRICITFRRATFRTGPKNTKMMCWDDKAENTTNTGPGSHDNFSEKVKNHEHQSKLNPYWTSRAENQTFWISTVLPIQWDPSGPQKLPYKIQNQAKIQWTPPAQVYTNFSVYRMAL